MSRRNGFPFNPIVLIGVITLTAVPAALLFPSFAQARQKPGPASRPSLPLRFTAAAFTEAPGVTYDGMECALAGSHGKALALDVRTGTNIPALRPAGPEKPIRQQLRVFPDGRIQNLLLGDRGYLTRFPAGPGRTTVRFAPLVSDEVSQVWNFMMGPEQSAAGGPESQHSTLVVAPVSEQPRSVWLLTATGMDQPMVLKERKFPISPDQLNQLPPGQRWDFRGDEMDEGLDSQHQALHRWENLLPIAAKSRHLLLCDTPSVNLATSGHWGCQIRNHVIDSCIPGWHNPSCPGTLISWKGSCTFNPMTGKCDCSH